MIHKPAGINKHFSVALVSDLLTEELGKEVLPCSIWKKLKSMFDLRAVEDREEKIPFSLEVDKFISILEIYYWSIPFILYSLSSKRSKI